MGNPIVRRLTVTILVVTGRPPDVPVPVLVILGASGLLKPFVLVTGVIDHQIHEKLHAPLMAALDQLLDICDRTIFIGDTVVVGDVIAHVHLWGLIGWTQPNNINAQVFDIVQFGDDTGDISNSIIIRVLE